MDFCAECVSLASTSTALPVSNAGLKATFLSTYLHTIVVFIALCLFAFEIYAVKNTGALLDC